MIYLLIVSLLVSASSRVISSGAQFLIMTEIFACGARVPVECFLSNSSNVVDEPDIGFGSVRFSVAAVQGLGAAPRRRSTGRRALRKSF